MTRTAIAPLLLPYQPTSPTNEAASANPRVDPDTHEAFLDGARIELTDLESRLLATLQRRQGKAVSRATLLEEVWGYEDDYSSNVVDVVVRRLRQKLGERAAMLETVRGVGYRWGA